MLESIQKITVETDEENPVTIAEITFDKINIADGYRVRLTPKYDQCSVSRGRNGSFP